MFWKSKDDKKVVKEIFYSNRKSNGEFVAKSKESGIPANEIANRDTSYIDKEQQKG